MSNFSHNGGRESKFCDMTCKSTHRQSTWQQHSSSKYRLLAENQLITSLFTVHLVANVMSPHLYWLADGSARVHNTVNTLPHCGVTYIKQKTVDIHHGSTPNAKLPCHTKTHMLYARCTMTIYGNITFHACLELVTSQDWRHNITESKTHNRELKTRPFSICEYLIVMFKILYYSL